MHNKNCYCKNCKILNWIDNSPSEKECSNCGERVKVENGDNISRRNLVDIFWCTSCLNAKICDKCLEKNVNYKIVGFYKKIDDKFLCRTHYEELDKVLLLEEDRYIEKCKDNYQPKTCRTCKEATTANNIYEGECYRCAPFTKAYSLCLYCGVYNLNNKDFWLSYDEQCCSSARCSEFYHKKHDIINGDSCYRCGSPGKLCKRDDMYLCDFHHDITDRSKFRKQRRRNIKDRTVTELPVGILPDKYGRLVNTYSTQRLIVGRWDKNSIYCVSQKL